MTVCPSPFHACTVPDAAREYIRRGWSPIPLPPGQKAPTLHRWTKLQPQEIDIPKYFRDGENVGVLLGEPSQWLIDVDLDVREAVALAPAFLPGTDAIFGRPGNPASHWLYRAERQLRTTRFQDEKGLTITEIRGIGCQTVFPPSRHTGEVVDWCKPGVPTSVDGKILSAAVARLSAAVVIVRHWPIQGSRQDAALALAGALTRAGWRPDEIAAFISAIARTARDEESAKRAAAADFTARRFAEFACRMRSPVSKSWGPVDVAGH